MQETALNELPQKKATPAIILFFNQFKSFLTGLLVLAAGVSYLGHDFLDGSLIVFIIFLNAGIGFFQEYKAKKDVEALFNMLMPVARVIRDGKEIELETKFIRRGDMVVLEGGSKIPADGELQTASNLMVDEAALTGESVPVLKEVGDKVFMGTVVLAGRAKVKISEIGVVTRFGQIAKNLEEVSEEKTPLEIKVSDLSRKLGLSMVGLILVVTGIGIFQGRNPIDMFFSGVALAVAAVPEGLPAVLTIALAIGVRRLSKRKAIVKRLAATEALGSVDVILTDKTGTLTRNEMTVRKIVLVDGSQIEVSGTGYSVNGTISGTGEVSELLKVAVLCNSSTLVLEEGNVGKFKVLGDTTEGALLILGKKAGINEEALKLGNPIRFELPFDATTRLMTVVTGSEALTKGAVEKVVSEAVNLNEEQKKKVLEQANKLASEGMRLVGFSKKKLGQEFKKEEVQKEMEFLGFVGIYDPPRAEVGEAIRICKGAGIHVVMATGDYPETARAIASEIGLIESGEEVVSGEQLTNMSEEHLLGNLLKIRVFARVTPGDKLRIVEAFQKLGRVVAVTGDGVNDAPALKRAQVGVAMGITGTDVAKEAADVIILDDNFSTIVAAIEEGRVIFVNLLKAIKFLLASNFGEVILVVFALLLGLPIPLSPLALLWINVVSDGFPALALAVDPKNGEVLHKSAHELHKGRAIFDTSDIVFLGATGLSIATVTMLGFYMTLGFGEATAKLVAFTLIVVLDLAVAFLVRGKKQKLFSNKYLVASVGITLLIQIIILLVPQFREVFV